MNIVNTTVRSILTDMIQVGIAIGAGEELDHDKEWHLERAEQQLREYLGVSDET